MSSAWSSARLADEARGADVRNALFCLLALVIVLLRVVFVDALTLRGGGVPDIALVLVVMVGLTQGPFTGMLTGFSAGLALDLAPPGGYLIGASALVFCLVGYGCGRLGGRADGRAYRASPLQLLVAVIAVAAGEAAEAATGLVARGSGVTPSAAWQGLPAAVLYDALLCALLLAVAALASRRSTARRSASLASGEPLRNPHGAFVPAQYGGGRSGAGRYGAGRNGAGRYAAIPIQASRRSAAGTRAPAGEGSAPRAFSAGGSGVSGSSTQASSARAYNSRAYSSRAHSARAYSVRQYQPAAYPRPANDSRGSAAGSRAYGSGSGAGRADLGNGLRRHGPVPGQAGRTGAQPRTGMTGRLSERAVRYRMSSRAFEHRLAGSRPGGTPAGSSRPRLQGTRRSGPRLDQGQSAMHRRGEPGSRRVRFRLKPERGGLRRQPAQGRRPEQSRIRLRASRPRNTQFGTAPVRPGGSSRTRLPRPRLAMPRIRLPWPLTGRPFPGSPSRPFLGGQFRRQSRICRNAPRWTGAPDLTAMRTQQGGGRRRFRNSGHLSNSGRLRNSGGARGLR
jgi:rod shape-determining protein MreD